MSDPNEVFIYVLFKPGLIKLFTRFNIISLFSRHLMGKIKSVTFNHWLDNTYYTHQQEKFEDKIWIEVKRTLCEDTLSKYNVCTINTEALE